MSSTIHHRPSAKPKAWVRCAVTRLAAVLLLSLPFHLAQAADTVYAATKGLSISSDGGATFSTIRRAVTFSDFGMPSL